MFMPPVFPAHWHVSQPVLIADTFSSLVWKVSLPDGTPAIVKGLKPIEDIADELRGGSSVLVDNIRWQSYLSGMTAAEAEEWGVDDSQRPYFVRYGVSKANYGAPFKFIRASC